MQVTKFVDILYKENLIRKWRFSVTYYQFLHHWADDILNTYLLHVAETFLRSVQVLSWSGISPLFFFYGNRKFFTAYTTARHLSVFSARSIHSMPPYHFSSFDFNIFLPSRYFKCYTWDVHFNSFDSNSHIYCRTTNFVLHRHGYTLVYHKLIISSGKIRQPMNPLRKIRRLSGLYPH
jgi:hypothetical protein